ncbi:MAG: hypothetical protein FH749_02480 [Firmicutes bacterium]|nr:hypothetical protein [Bacillota bacterium]
MFVDGLGSYFSIDAYFSDLPCTDEWLEIQHAEECTECSICANSCPTGAIGPERFMINNERCLTYFNESPRKIPDWVPLSAHHCLYGCLKCQLSCPMNQDYELMQPGVVKFTEEETDMLLTKKQKEFTPGLKEKCRVLGLDQWIAAIPRNLKILLEQNSASASH